MTEQELKIEALEDEIELLKSELEDSEKENLKLEDEIESLKLELEDSEKENLKLEGDLKDIEYDLKIERREIEENAEEIALGIKRLEYLKSDFTTLVKEFETKLALVKKNFNSDIQLSLFSEVSIFRELKIEHFEELEEVLADFKSYL